MLLNDKWRIDYRPLLLRILSLRYDSGQAYNPYFLVIISARKRQPYPSPLVYRRIPEDESYSSPEPLTEALPVVITPYLAPLSDCAQRQRLVLRSFVLSPMLLVLLPMGFLKASSCSLCDLANQRQASGIHGPDGDRATIGVCQKGVDGSGH